MDRREFLRISGLVGLSAGGWSLTGCGLFESGTPGSTEAGAGKKLLRITSGPVEVLDPQVITNAMWLNSRGIFEGLVSQNAAGDDVVPAVAEKWDISDDELTYTFHIRENAKWSNGDPITADDFERTCKRLFTPGSNSAGGTTMGANSYQASTGIKGATEFLAGAETDWSKVGVDATGEREITYTLSTPNPDFLLALTHPALLPLHMDSVESKPEDWQNPPHIVTNGPYTVEKWVKNSRIDLVPNEEYWDRENVFLDGIEIQLVEPTTSGTATVPYENGEVDIMPIGGADVLRFQEDPKLSEHLQSVDTYSIAYLGKLRSEHGALEDVRVRRALSLALDRKTLAQILPGAEPGLSLVTDRVQGWTEEIAIDEDLDEAKQLLADAGYPEGKGLPEVRILAGVDVPLVDAIIDTWKNNLGIEARSDIVEAGVYVERRWQVQKGDYIGFYFGTFAGLPTWPTMVGTLWSPRDILEFSMSGDAWGRYQKIEQSKQLDAKTKSARLTTLMEEETSPGARKMADLVEQATKELDEERSVELFEQAAKAREEEYLFVPVLWLSSFFAVRPTVRHLQLRAYPDFFYFKPLDMDV